MGRADVNLRAKEAVVAFDPGQVTVEQMLEALNRLGFRASAKGAKAGRHSFPVWRMSRCPMFRPAALTSGSEPCEIGCRQDRR